MAAPEDTGVDKQKVLKSVAEGAVAPLPPPRPAPPASRATAPAASVPPATPGTPVSPSVWRHRHWFSTVVLGTVGALWLGAGLAGKWRLGLAVGAGLLALTLLSLALLLVRRFKSA